MSSKIKNEITEVTGYKWDSKKNEGANTIALCGATDDLVDADYDEMSKAAKDFIDAVITALEAKEDVPEFPDYVAPRTRRRRTPEGVAEEVKPVTEPKARRAPKKAPPKVEDAEPVDPEPVYAEPVDPEPVDAEPEVVTRKKNAKKAVTGESAAKEVVRGETMQKFRDVILLNPTATKSELMILAVGADCPVTSATCALVRYNTCHTLRRLKELGMYDHDDTMANLAAAAE